MRDSRLSPTSISLTFFRARLDVVAAKVVQHLAHKKFVPRGFAPRAAVADQRDVGRTLQRGKGGAQCHGGLPGAIPGHYGSADRAFELARVRHHQDRPAQFHQRPLRQVRGRRIEIVLAVMLTEHDQVAGAPMLHHGIDGRAGHHAQLASQSIVTGQKAIDLDLLPDTPAILLGGPGVMEIPATAERFGALIEQVAELPLHDSVADIRIAVQELRTTLVSVQHTLDGAQTMLEGDRRNCS